MNVMRSTPVVLLVSAAVALLLIVQFGSLVSDLKEEERLISQSSVTSTPTPTPTPISTATAVPTKGSEAPDYIKTAQAKPPTPVPSPTPEPTQTPIPTQAPMPTQTPIPLPPPSDEYIEWGEGVYYDIGSSGEPHLNNFSSSVSQSTLRGDNWACDLGGYQDWSYRTTSSTQPSTVSIPVEPGQHVRIMFCVDERPGKSDWVTRAVGVEPGIDSCADWYGWTFNREARTRVSKITVQIDQSCVNGDEIGIEFLHTGESSGDVPIWGFTVHQGHDKDQMPPTATVEPTTTPIATQTPDPVPTKGTDAPDYIQTAQAKPPTAVPLPTATQAPSPTPLPTATQVPTAVPSPTPEPKSSLWEKIDFDSLRNLLGRLIDSRQSVVVPTPNIDGEAVSKLISVQPTPTPVPVQQPNTLVDTGVCVGCAPAQSAPTAAPIVANQPDGQDSSGNQGQRSLGPDYGNASCVVDTPSGVCAAGLSTGPVYMYPDPEPDADECWIAPGPDPWTNETVDLWYCAYYPH